MASGILNTYLHAIIIIHVGAYIKIIIPGKAWELTLLV